MHVYKLYDRPCETTLREVSPDDIVLHAGTNDLKTKITAGKIAKANIDLVTSLKNNENLVTISNIVAKLGELKNKAKAAKDFLVQVFKKKNTPLLSHAENIDHSNHLNECKFYLNHHAVTVSVESFPKFLVKLN